MMDTNTNDETAIARSLTPPELEALRYFQTHDVYLIPDEDAPGDDFDRLFLKGLLLKKYTDIGGVLAEARYFLTDLGKRVLASAPPSDPHPSKPAGGAATITAAEFVEQGYAEKIKRGECEVTFENNQIFDVTREKPIDSTYWIWSKVPEKKVWMCEAGDTLAVTWLDAPEPTSPQPVPSDVPAGDEADDFYVKMADELVKTGKLIVELKDEYKAEKARWEAENAALRNQLQAAKDTIRGLRELCGRAADALEGHSYTFTNYAELRDDLRQAAKRVE